MIGEQKLQQLHQFVDQYSKEELIWINGYISGLVANPVNGRQSATAVPTSLQKITLVYGTETGNAKKLASDFSAIAKHKNCPVKLTSLDQYRLSDLANEKLFVVVISTQGEGEPPAAAKKFYDYIHQNQLKLKDLQFAVLGLGDSSYPLFCKTADDVFDRFLAFESKPILPVLKCDLDYETEAKEWFESLLKKISSGSVVNSTTPQVAIPKAKEKTKKWYQGMVATTINLNDRGSNKKTYHVEITCNEDIEYEPGDAIGLIPSNDSALVQKILEIWPTQSELEIPGFPGFTAIQILTSKVNIHHLLNSTIKKYAALTGQEIPEVRMNLFELLRLYPPGKTIGLAEILPLLTPIAPRLYSVSSSPANLGTKEVHITVAHHYFSTESGEQSGLCSRHVSEWQTDTIVHFYVHRQKHFKLPTPDADIIMIGPGTGIAPFRSFLAERDATGAGGKNWFFFGEQHFTTDFLYQTEIQQWIPTGVLSKLSLAFSRDQKQKIYVQHRMQEEAADLYKWILDGAYIYVSGTKDPMSQQVEETLLTIFQQQGNHTVESAGVYLATLKKEGRYQKDVY